jgi:outer membrane protein assembly factor BamA
MLELRAKAVPTLIIAFTLIWPKAFFGQCPVAAKPGLHDAETTEHPSSQALKIKEIVFLGETGLTPVEQAEIVDSVRGKVGNYEPKWVDSFELQLSAEWQQRGYFKATVKAKAQEVGSTPEERTFVVTAQVESGRRYFFGDLSFLRGTQFSTAQMRSMFSLQTNELFNTERIGEGLDALRKAYGSRGFIDFVAVPNVLYDEVHGQISVEVDLQEGKQYRISEIKAIGIDPDSAKTLLHASGLESGNIFSARLLEDFYNQHQAVKVERCVDWRAGKIVLLITFPGGSSL